MNLYRESLGKESGIGDNANEKRRRGRRLHIYVTGAANRQTSGTSQLVSVAQEECQPLPPIHAEIGEYQLACRETWRVRGVSPPVRVHVLPQPHCPRGTGLDRPGPMGITFTQVPPSNKKCYICFEPYSGNEFSLFFIKDTGQGRETT